MAKEKKGRKFGRNEKDCTRYAMLHTLERNKRLKKARHEARMALKAVKKSRYIIRLAKSRRVVQNRAWKRARAAAAYVAQ